MDEGSRTPDAPRAVTRDSADRFISPTDTRDALQALRRSCLEWPSDVVAEVVSQVLLDGQEGDPALARTTHESIARFVEYYRSDADPPDIPPDWLTPAIMARISQGLRNRAS